jgi:glycosyltransferase involved in cell wall biosynthesis
LPESGASNGIVTYTRIMRDALRSLGHSVVVVTSDHIEHSDGAVAELPMPNRIVAGLRTMYEARQAEDGSDPWVRLRIVDAFRAARRAGVDVFEIEESFGWAGRMVGRGAAIVERLHGPHVFVRDEFESGDQKRRGDLREAAEFASFGKVEAVTAPTHRLLGKVIALGLDPMIASTIPNPVMVVPEDAVWRVGGVNLNQVLFVGRFDLCKGADIAIRAFAHALAENPALRLVMVGPDSGVTRCDGTREGFDQFVANEVSPEVRACIRFLGVQPPARIAELRLQSAFALVTSRFETFSYALTEAMALGMPVLASNSFGPGEVVQDGMTGRLVPIGDHIAIGKAIIEMASNPPLLAAMGNAGYAWVAEWLAPERIARETIRVYREAICRSQAPQRR